MTTSRHRDGWVMAGMAIAAASAATASFTGLRGLALAAGWPDRLAWLLPLTIDAYAMTSTRVWLAPGRTRRGQGFAQANAIGAIGASILGNAVYHMLSTGLLNMAWPIVVTVGSVPAAVLGLTAHLHALRTVEREPAPAPEAVGPPEDPGPAPSGREGDQSPTHPPVQDDPKSGPQDRPEARTGEGTDDAPRDRSGDELRDRTRSRPNDAPLPRPRARSRRRAKPRTEDELIEAARTADARYRAGHDGHPITRDALRVALRIAGPRATELRRQLAAESAPTAQPSAPNASPRESNEPTTTPDRKEALTTA